MKKTVGFLTNIGVAEEFFKRCLEREAVTEEERNKILLELVAELKAVKLTEEDVTKQVRNKKVLIVKGRKKSG